jgi:hypothetical protein
MNILHYQDHYMYIKNINRFFNSSETHSYHVCLRCLTSFSSKEVLANHKLKCEQHDYCKLKIPKNAKLEFTKYNFRNIIPFVIYADFESISQTIYGPDNAPVNVPKTKKLKQSSSAVGILIKSDHEEIISTQYISYFNEDVIEDFCKFLIDIEYRFSQIFTTDLKINITPEETLIFENAKTCYYCDQIFEDRETTALLEIEESALLYEEPEDFEEDEYDFEDGEYGTKEFSKFSKSLIKVRDHDHLTGSLEELLIVNVIY